MVLKNPIENIIFENNWEGFIKSFQYLELKKYVCEGYQIFELIDDKLFGVLEGPPIHFMKMDFFNLR